MRGYSMQLGRRTPTTSPLFSPRPRKQLDTFKASSFTWESYDGFNDWWQYRVGLMIIAMATSPNREKFKKKRESQIKTIVLGRHLLKKLKGWSRTVPVMLVIKWSRTVNVQIPEIRTYSASTFICHDDFNDLIIIIIIISTHKFKIQNRQNEKYKKGKNQEPLHATVCVQWLHIPDLRSEKNNDKKTWSWKLWWEKLWKLRWELNGNNYNDNSDDNSSESWQW